MAADELASGARGRRASSSTGCLAPRLEVGMRALPSEASLSSLRNDVPTAEPCVGFR